MRRIFVRDEDPSAAIAALLRALGTKYPREKTRIDNAPELCGIAPVYVYDTQTLTPVKYKLTFAVKVAKIALQSEKLPIALPGDLLPRLRL
jgi:hypothetical protein